MFAARLPEGRPMMFWPYIQSLARNHMRQQRSESSREQRVVLYKSDQLLECTKGSTC